MQPTPLQLRIEELKDKVYPIVAKFVDMKHDEIIPYLEKKYPTGIAPFIADMADLICNLIFRDDNNQYHGAILDEAAVDDIKGSLQYYQGRYLDMLRANQALKKATAAILDAMKFEESPIL